MSKPKAKEHSHERFIGPDARPSARVSRDPLYFTRMENVEAIQREGLQAASQETVEGVTSIVGGDGLLVVYLTSTPTAALTDAELALSPTKTYVSKRWLGFASAEPLARFTLKIPTHDRNLLQYERWLRGALRRNMDVPHPDNPVLRRALKTWWLHFGDIPPSKIVGCDIEPSNPAGAKPLTKGC